MRIFHAPFTTPKSARRTLAPGRPGSRARLGVPALSTVFVAAFLLCLGGEERALAQGGDKARSKESQRQKEGRELFSKPGGKAGAGGWCIVLEAFSGPRAMEEAQSRLGEVAAAAGRADVSIRQTARGAAIVAGSYTKPDSPEARADLAAVRKAVVRNEAPFAKAFFAPPEETEDPGLVPELNLLSAKATFGRQAQYTLQIAVYEAAERAKAKRAAEEAALRLRRDGELAFYYHGPARSSVTVGVFSDKDFDARLTPKNPALVALQQRYPDNLLNGQFPIVEKGPGGEERKQPSTLVQIPE